MCIVHIGTDNTRTKALNSRKLSKPFPMWVRLEFGKAFFLSPPPHGDFLPKLGSPSGCAIHNKHSEALGCGSVGTAPSDHTGHQTSAFLYTSVIFSLACHPSQVSRSKPHGSRRHFHIGKHQWSDWPCLLWPVLWIRGIFASTVHVGGVVLAKMYFLPCSVFLRRVLPAESPLTNSAVAGQFHDVQILCLYFRLLRMVRKSKHQVTQSQCAGLHRVSLCCDVELLTGDTEAFCSEAGDSATKPCGL